MHQKIHASSPIFHQKEQRQCVLCRPRGEQHSSDSLASAELELCIGVAVNCSHGNVLTASRVDVGIPLVN